MQILFGHYCVVILGAHANKFDLFEPISLPFHNIISRFRVLKPLKQLLVLILDHSLLLLVLRLICQRCLRFISTLAQQILAVSGALPDRIFAFDDFSHLIDQHPILLLDFSCFLYNFIKLMAVS